MRHFKTFGSVLATAALLTSTSLQAQTRSAASLPQARVVHETMPADATIIDEDSLDYCYDGDVFSRAGVLLEEAGCGEAAAAVRGDAVAASPFQGGSGIVIGLLAGVTLLAGIIAAAGNKDDTPDSPG